MPYTYLLQEREHMRALPDSAAAFDLWVIGEHSEQPIIHAVVDWQDGMMILKTEVEEPNDWMLIADQVRLALVEARSKMPSAIWDM